MTDVDALANEVRAAYAEHDTAPTPTTWTRLCAAIRAKTAAVNPDELEELS